MTTRRALAFLAPLALLRRRGAAAQVPTVDGSLVLGDNERVVLTADNPDGTISRLVTFLMRTAVDRPWLSWLDERGRHRVALGYHSLTTDGEPHHRFEVKTSEDPSGPNPGGMATRFGIGTDANRVEAGFHAIDELILNGNVGPRTDLTVRQDWDGTNLPVWRLRGEHDAGGNTVASLNPYAVAPKAGKRVTFRLFRDTNTDGPVSFAVMRGDGSNAAAFVVDAKTGAITLANGASIRGGDGSPEGVVAANPGSAYHSTNGNVYRKAAGTGPTGWTAT